MSLSTRNRIYKSCSGYLRFLALCGLFALPVLLNLFPVAPLCAFGPTTGLTDRVSLSNLGVQANGDSGKSATVRCIRAERAGGANEKVGDLATKQEL